MNCWCAPVLSAIGFSLCRKTKSVYPLHSSGSGLVKQGSTALCNFSNENEVGFVAVTGPREYEVIIGQGCYFVNPSTNLAETALLVDPAWQGTGLGGSLQRRLAEHA